MSNSSSRQGMFESSPDNIGQYGKSSTTRLKKSFPGSPINLGSTNKIDSFDRNGVRSWYGRNVLRGETNDGGHTFGTFDMDYSASPNYDDVVTGDAGKPATAWVPNPSSPGNGNGVSPYNQPAAPEDFGTHPSDTPFEGEGSQLTPQDSSKRTVTRMYARDFLRSA